ELLRALDHVGGLRRVRFTSPHPHDFTPDVIEAMASSRVVCEHIHFPLQSGSDRVLSWMRRSYRIERYHGWLERIRDAVPGVAVSTDIIVGFPGETEEDFSGTLGAVERARFDSAYTFRYSTRAGTRAASLPEQVSPGVVQDRFERLVAATERIALERNRDQIGRRVELLVEEAGSRKDAAKATARTRTNKIVHVPADGLEAGSFVDAILTGAHPHHLDGVLA
ncbi:MAG: radical SAM protein, partial [Chloroflexi bacterium]|nr:radical SAM protein [Chloroflexota bacterium]